MQYLTLGMVLGVRLNRHWSGNAATGKWNNMAEKISFTIDLAGLSNYTPVEGIGTSSLLKMDGLYSATINKVTLGKSASGNHKFILSLSVLDADEKGASLLSDVLVSGTDKNGTPNIRQFGDLLLSIGMTQEQIRAFAGNGQQPGEGVAQTITGKTVFCNVEAETYNGNTRSRVQGFVNQQRYTDAVSANAHRKPRKSETSFVSAPITTTTAAVTVPTVTVTAPPANGTTSVAAVDPMSRLKGLNLPV
jgi:hypothetical protein